MESKAKQVLIRNFKKKKKKSHLYRDETTTAKVESGLENAATSTESEDRQTGS